MMSKAQNRPKRTPLNKRDILTTDQRTGYVRRWVNDEPGRIEMFKEAGYAIVDSPTKVGDKRAGDASNLTSVVRKPVGGGQEAVLMEIKQEWYDEDREEAEQEMRKKERGLIPDELKDSKSYGDGVSISSSLEQSSGGPKVTIK